MSGSAKATVVILPCNTATLQEKNVCSKSGVNDPNLDTSVGDPTHYRCESSCFAILVVF